MEAPREVGRLRGVGQQRSHARQQRLDLVLGQLDVGIAQQTDEVVLRRGQQRALEIEPGLSALVITKGTRAQSSSVHAQGGVAAVLGPDDSFDQHVADTLEAGGSLCDPEVVKRVVCEGPERIRELIEWGTEFDREGDVVALSREGCTLAKESRKASPRYSTSSSNLTLSGSVSAARSSTR